MSLMTSLAGVALMPGAAIPPAMAQNYAGEWRCEMANHTVTNNAFENWTYSFALALYGNGSFEAQGPVLCPDQRLQHAVPGAWKLGGFAVRGSGAGAGAAAGL